MTSLEYLAGVLDVSGTLMIAYRKDRICGPAVMVMIQNDDRRLPDMFARRFGGKVTKASLKCGRTRYSWGKRGYLAQEMLKELLPYMPMREREIQRLLSVTINPRGGRRIAVEPSKSIGSELLRVAARTEIATGDAQIIHWLDEVRAA